MKKTTQLLIICFSAFVLIHCNNTEKESFGNKKNPLYGIIFRNIEEIPQLKGFITMWGEIMPNIDEDTSKDYNKLEISILENEDRSTQILILAKYIYKAPNLNPTYQILDTITINNVKENELSVFGTCTIDKDTIFNPEIIGFAWMDANTKAKNRLFKLHTIRAWRADRKKGKIIPIKNPENINCFFIEDYDCC